jgi:two-component system alkaline phosphatase synthesis response regulator PhoP
MDANDYTILLVDDEPDILEFVGYNLRKEGYRVSTASNGQEALDIARQIHPQLIMLDVMMPRMDGMETCEKIRSTPDLADTMILFLTARSEDYSQIAGFEAGADDYITKPVKIKVLLSRIKALLKRHKHTVEDSGPIIGQGNIRMDPERFLVYIGEASCTLPKKEFELLQLLMSKPERVFTRDEIFNAIWGDDVIVGDRTIDVHIRKLRERIGDEYIKTIKGVGYKFTEA